MGSGRFNETPKLVYPDDAPSGTVFIDHSVNQVEQKLSGREELERKFVEKYGHLGNFAIAYLDPEVDMESYVMIGGTSQQVHVNQVRRGFVNELRLAFEKQPKKKQVGWLNDFFTEADKILRPFVKDPNIPPF
ncbi:MAG: hypothetical protein AAB521_04945 [Patescibacteria group bacterium]